MAKNYKKDPQTVELIWTGISNLKNVIALTYDIDHDKRTLSDLEASDKEMYDFYYQLNDMSLLLADRKVMKFQNKK